MADLAVSARQHAAELLTACNDNSLTVSALAVRALACAADVDPLCDALDAAEQAAVRLGQRAHRAEEDAAELRRRIDGALVLLGRVGPGAGPGHAAKLLGDLRLLLESGRDAQPGVAA